MMATKIPCDADVGDLAETAYRSRYEVKMKDYSFLEKSYATPDGRPSLGARTSG